MRGRPYWRSIEPELAVGYRRRAGQPGSWTIRQYKGGGVYDYEVIGIADDFADADGERVLSFAQAQRKALERKPKVGDYTVASAVEAYLQHIRDKGGTYDAGHRARALILPQLGGERVETLTSERLRKWLVDMAEAPRRKRTARGEQQQYCEIDLSEEGRRKRRGSANRVLTTLKAALTFAFREGHVASDAAWRRVKPFTGTVAAGFGISA